MVSYQNKRSRKRKTIKNEKSEETIKKKISRT